MDKGDEWNLRWGGAVYFGGENVRISKFRHGRFLRPEIFAVTVLPSGESRGFGVLIIFSRGVDPQQGHFLLIFLSQNLRAFLPLLFFGGIFAFTFFAGIFAFTFFEGCFASTFF